jgi:hypothetical protein
MKTEKRFLRFDGRLWEDMTFEPIPGWETTRIAHRPEEGDGSYRLELRSDENEVLTFVSPLVDFTSGCPSKSDAMRWVRVGAYVPFPPEACRLLFRRGERVLYEADVADEPPRIRINEVSREKEGQMRLHWTAEASGDRPLTFNVAYVVGGERGFSMARGLEDTEHLVDLSGLPGGAEAQLGVLATDGVRSASAISDPFEVAEKPPLLWIQSPDDERTYPADQPLTLLGQALDVAGARLPEKGLVWRVDNEVVARDTRTALADALDPGPHRVTLQYAPGKEPLAERTVSVRVAERSKQQQRLMDMLQ